MKKLIEKSDFRYLIIMIHPLDDMTSYDLIWKKFYGSRICFSFDEYSWKCYLELGYVYIFVFPTSMSDANFVKFLHNVLYL